MKSAGGYPLEFNTIAVSDGISMGHEGMRASLVSREIIADSVEAVMHAERFDALVKWPDATNHYQNVDGLCSHKSPISICLWWINHARRTQR